MLFPFWLIVSGWNRTYTVLWLVETCLEGVVGERYVLKFSAGGIFSGDGILCLTNTRYWVIGVG